MKQTSQFVLLTITLGLLTACSTTTRQAPVVDRTSRCPGTPAAGRRRRSQRQGRPQQLHRAARATPCCASRSTTARTTATWWPGTTWPTRTTSRSTRCCAWRRRAAAAGRQTQPVADAAGQPVRPVPRKTAPRADKRRTPNTAMADAQKDEAGKPRRPEAGRASRAGRAAAVAGGTGIAPGSHRDRHRRRQAELDVAVGRHASSPLSTKARTRASTSPAAPASKSWPPARER